MPVIGHRYKEGITKYDFLHPTLDRRHEVLYFPPGHHDITPVQLQNSMAQFLLRIFEDEEEGNDRGELNILRREMPKVVSAQTHPSSLSSRPRLAVSQIQLGPDNEPYVIESTTERRGKEEVMVYLVLKWVWAIPANAMTFVRERRQS